MEYKLLIRETFQSAGISSVILAFLLSLVLFLSLLFNHPAQETFTLHWSETRVWQRGCLKKFLEALLDQLLWVGISQAWDKQAAWILQGGGKEQHERACPCPTGE